MPIDSETLRQIGHLIRPLATRSANTIARATIQLVDDGAKMQLVQLGGVVGGPYPGAENFQPFGLSGVPLGGSEVIVLFPNGDRSHPLVIAVSHRGSRPTGGEPGDMTVYSPGSGAKVRLLASGDIEIEPAAGKEVRVATPGGTSAAVATKQDLQILRTAMGTAVIALGAGGAAAITTAADVLVAALVPPPSPPTWPIGTKTLKGE